MDFSYFLSFLFVCFLYMIFPIIKVFGFKTKLTRKGATALARNNSIVVFLIICILLYGAEKEISYASIILVCILISIIFFLLNRWLYTNANMTKYEKTILEKIEKKEYELSTLSNEEDDEQSDEEKKKIKKLEKEIKELNGDLNKKESNMSLNNNKIISKEVMKKEKYCCSNCGAEIKEYDKYCPNCGESFEEEYEKEKKKKSTSIDQKYDDLLKIKELYDKKIITKEEFDSEKIKILK